MWVLRKVPILSIFLSTLSLRRATNVIRHAINFHPFLSTLSLRRATRCKFSWNDGKIISIHALLAESDNNSRVILRPKNRHFYPRSPCGERPSGTTSCSICSSISIHALLAESDCMTDGSICLDSISIHALLAESDGRNEHNINRGHKISIHALLAESDRTQSQSLFA